MLRSLLVGFLALSAASACKGTSDAPAVQPGAPVGKVVELSGDVSATRGSAKRVLATGQEISGDDVIETGAQGHVRILFAHNNAAWELGPSKKVTVSESLAWKLPKQDTPAETVDEATLAAGRHAERETVTTTSTAPTPPSAQAAPAQTEPAPDPMAAAPGGGGDLKAKRKERPAPVEKNKPAAVEENKPAAVEENKRAPAKTMGSRRMDSAPLMDPPAPPPPPADLASLVKKRVVDEHAMLGACVKTGTLAIEVVVDKGVTSFVLPAGTPPEVASCFKTAAAKIRFPESYTLRVKTSVAK